MNLSTKKYLHNPKLNVMISQKFWKVFEEYYGYPLMCVFLEIWRHFQGVHWVVGVIFWMPILILDVISSTNVRYIAYAYTHRNLMAVSIMSLSILSGVLLEVLYPPDKISITLLVQFLLQGIIAGVMIRMLVLAVFARLLRAQNIGAQKFLLIIGLTIFIFLFPFQEPHKHLAGLYVFGFGVGFLAHFIVRNNEHIVAQRNRLVQYMFNLIEISKRENSITDTEEKALRFFVHKKWKKLETLLENQKKLHKKTNHQSHDEYRIRIRLLLIEFSMMRYKGEYHKALEVINRKLEEEESDKKNKYFKDYKHFFYLHLALNYGEIFENNRRPHHQDMFENLSKAYDTNPECLLTNASFGLRIAEEDHLNNLKIKLPSKKHIPSEEMDALSFLWNAMKINEEYKRPRIEALLTGMTIPVNWTFLLDAYAYVLFKSKLHRFSKALLLRCMYEDPTFSSPYLHLAEWYNKELDNLKKIERRESERERIKDEIKAQQITRTARLCLNIALQIEGERNGLIANRAKKILDYI